MPSSALKYKYEGFLAGRSVEHMTLGLRVMSSSPPLGTELTFKKNIHTYTNIYSIYINDFSNTS